MANFWKLVNRILERSDIVLEIVDARFIEETRNKEIEDKIKKKQKLFIIVANKSDLADTDELVDKVLHLPNCVMLSSKNKQGTAMLKKKILSLAKGGHVKVGVVGYPNTGKSSVINALAGSSKAKTSAQSGHTRALQLIRAGPRIMLIDTPGVIPYMQNNEASLAAIGSVDANQLKDPIMAAEKLIEKISGKVIAFYGLDLKPEQADDPDEIIEAVAKKKNLLMSGARPDVRLASITIIKDWQKGMIKR
jgi:hypothetical protein